MNKYVLLLCAAMVSAYAMEEKEVGSTIVPLYKLKKHRYPKPWMLRNKGGAFYARIRENATLKVIEPVVVHKHENNPDDPTSGVALFDKYDSAEYDLSKMQFPVRVRITNRKTGKLKLYFVESPEELDRQKWYPTWDIASY